MNSGMQITSGTLPTTACSGQIIFSPQNPTHLNLQNLLRSLNLILKNKVPETNYTRTELLDYLQYCRNKSFKLISSITAENLNDRWINDYKNYSLLEILLYNLRHIQHHTAQLNLILRQTIDDAPGWVERSKV